MSMFKLFIYSGGLSIDDKMYEALKRRRWEGFALLSISTWRRELISSKSE